MNSKTKKIVANKRTNTKPDKYAWHFNVFNGYTNNEKTEIQKILRKNIIGQQFKRDDLLMAKSAADLNTIKTPIIYRSGKQYENMLFSFNFLHHGQRKLFNTELYLLSKYLKTHNAKANVIYAGAAAGNHFPYLSSLFPNVDFYLYDPAKFAIKETNRIHIYNEFFTDDVATSWGPGGNMSAKHGDADFFLCDIRVDISDKSDEDREAQVTEDMNRQLAWAKLVKPKKASMLKFRPPYVSNAQLEYLPGHILWQTWPPKASGETRLITEYKQFDKPLVIYNVGTYENLAAYHNIVERSYSRYTDLPLFNMVPGYNGGWDCRAEAETWIMYLDIVKGAKPTPGAIANKMNALTRALKQPLVGHASYHGRYNRFTYGNKWLWMITRALQNIDRKAYADKRNKHEVDRVRNRGVIGYLVKRPGTSHTKRKTKKQTAKKQK